MLERLMNVIKAMFSRGMEKLETPEVLAEQAQDQLESSVKEVVQAVTQAIANEKLLEQQIKKNAEDLASWEKRAKTAVEQNNDEIAKQCLQKKHELNQQSQVLTKQLEDQKNTTAALKARHAELDTKLKEFMVKKDGMVQRTKAGDAVAKANEILSSKSGTGMDKYEQKIIEREARAAALGELSSTPTEQKLKELDQNSQVEDELAALKAQAGKVKLVVDKEQSAKPADKKVPMVPDEDNDNLPMVPDDNPDHLPIDVEEIKDDDEDKPAKK